MHDPTTAQCRQAISRSCPELCLDVVAFGDSEIDRDRLPAMRPADRRTATRSSTTSEQRAES
jgi:hypothetical protein